MAFSSFSRRGPDVVTEELIAVLSGPKAYEFKTLFLIVYEALRARNAASGGEEMLRLRAYEKLQNLVRQGQVRKNGKQYKGLRRPLLQLAESLKAQAATATPAKPKAKPAQKTATPAKKKAK